MAPTKRPSNNDNAQAATASGSVKRSRCSSAQPLDEVHVQNNNVKQEDADDDTTFTHPSSGSTDSPTDQKPSPPSESTITALIDSRQNDFSERSWWLVDIDSPTSESSTTQGATSLVKRCMRAYSWSLPQTRKILTSYQQFLSLKKLLGDWDATLLSPSHLVDLMWHQHILDNYNYYHDMIMLCGHFVGHNPDGALDVEAKRQRDKFTRECLRQHFGSYDTEVWPLGRESNNAGLNDGRRLSINLSGGNGNRANNGAMEAPERPPNVGKARNNGNRVQNNDAWGDGNRAVNGAREVNMRPAEGHGNRDERITIRLKDQSENGEATMFMIKRSTRMGKVFNAFAQRKGVEVCSLSFYLDGERIGPDDTPSTLLLDDDDQIDVMREMPTAFHENRGGVINIILRDNSYKTMYTVKRTIRMERLFNAYVQRKGVERSSLLFMLDGERVYGNSTPLELDLEKGDEISVFRDQSGC